MKSSLRTMCAFGSGELCVPKAPNYSKGLSRTGESPRFSSLVHQVVSVHSLMDAGRRHKTRDLITHSSGRSAAGPTTYRVTRGGPGIRHVPRAALQERNPELQERQSYILASKPAGLCSGAEGRGGADYFCYTGHEASLTFAPKGAAISVFQGCWKILEDKLDFTGFLKTSLNEILPSFSSSCVSFTEIMQINSSL